MEASLLETVIPYGYGALAVALAIAMVRLIKGPSLPDRVIVLDLIASIAIGFIAVTILANNEPAFLTVAAVLALVVFLGSLAFARYLQRSGRNE
ncbi:MAG: pH regulation protein F [Chloroflexi bacterium]|nr:pH regulation protein F [Chloroflexota bacterium]